MVMHACEYKSFDWCLLAGFNLKIVTKLNVFRISLNKTYTYLHLTSKQLKKESYQRDHLISNILNSQGQNPSIIYM